MLTSVRDHISFKKTFFPPVLDFTAVLAVELTSVIVITAITSSENTQTPVERWDICLLFMEHQYYGCSLCDWLF